MEMEKTVIFLKKNLKINMFIANLPSIVIIQVIIEVLHIEYVIENKIYLSKFL